MTDPKLPRRAVLASPLLGVVPSAETFKPPAGVTVDWAKKLIYVPASSFVPFGDDWVLSDSLARDILNGSLGGRLGDVMNLDVVTS